MDNTINDMLENPEKYVQFAYIGQLLDIYGELFTPIEDDSQPVYIYIEKLNKNTNKLFRFIALYNGVVAISSEHKNHIWDIDFTSEEGLKLLGILDDVIEERKSNDIQELVQEITLDEEKYFLRIFPFRDQQASQVLSSELDDRLMRYNLK